MTQQLSTVLKPLKQYASIYNAVTSKLTENEKVIPLDSEEAWPIVRQELLKQLHLPKALDPNQYLLFKYAAHPFNASRVEIDHKIYDVLVGMAKEKPISTECVICTDSISYTEASDTELIYLSSGHVFHQDELKEWAQGRIKNRSEATNPSTGLPLHPLDVQALNLDIQALTPEHDNASDTMNKIIQGYFLFLAVAGISAFGFLCLAISTVYGGSVVCTGGAAALTLNTRFTNRVFKVAENDTRTIRWVQGILFVSFVATFLSLVLTGETDKWAKGFSESNLPSSKDIPRTFFSVNFAASVSFAVACFCAAFVRDCLVYRAAQEPQDERRALLGNIN